MVRLQNGTTRSDAAPSSALWVRWARRSRSSHSDARSPAKATRTVTSGRPWRPTSRSPGRCRYGHPNGSTVSAMAVQGPRIHADINAVVGGYLRDLAFAQSSQQKMFGYKRAAAAIFALDTPLTDLIGPDGAWPKIPGIGPGSARVIREVLETGGSPAVEQAIEASDRRADIERRRQLRRHFLSRAEVRRILSDPSFAGPTVSSTSATCKCTPNGATAPRRCRTSRMPVLSVVINTRRSPITHTD